MIWSDLSDHCVLSAQDTRKLTLYEPLLYQNVGICMERRDIGYIFAPFFLKSRASRTRRSRVDNPLPSETVGGPS